VIERPHPLPRIFHRGTLEETTSLNQTKNDRRDPNRPRCLHSTSGDVRYDGDLRGSQITCCGPYSRSLLFGYPSDGIRVNPTNPRVRNESTRPTRQEKPTGLSFANGQYDLASVSPGLRTGPLTHKTAPRHIWAYPRGSLRQAGIAAGGIIRRLDNRDLPVFPGIRIARL
jgi:hypothetical protein